ncbi:MAG: metallophosphoesterase family protein [Candidatus Omnitrophota bacterium]
MRWGIFSDIHANLEAFQAVLASFAQECIERYACLGDIVGYGANPGECIAEVQRYKPLVIAGNHDRGACGLFDINSFSAHAQVAIEWTSKNLASEEKHYLHDLPLVEQRQELSFVHGSLDHPEEFNYIFDSYSAAVTLEFCQTRLCFIGHTHVPAIFIREGEECLPLFTPALTLKPKHTYLINAGSVGQPRDGNPQASYVVYDSESRFLQIKRVAYDIRKTKDKIIKAGLPAMLAERLSMGR